MFVRNDGPNFIYLEKWSCLYSDREVNWKLFLGGTCTAVE